MDNKRLFMITVFIFLTLLLLSLSRIRNRETFSNYPKTINDIRNEGNNIQLEKLHNQCYFKKKCLPGFKRVKDEHNKNMFYCSGKAKENRNDNDKKKRLKEKKMCRVGYGLDKNGKPYRIVSSRLEKMGTYKTTDECKSLSKYKQGGTRKIRKNLKKKYDRKCEEYAVKNKYRPSSYKNEHYFYKNQIVRLRPVCKIGKLPIAPIDFELNKIEDTSNIFKEKRNEYERKINNVKISYNLIIKEFRDIISKLNEGTNNIIKSLPNQFNSSSINRLINMLNSNKIPETLIQKKDRISKDLEKNLLNDFSNDKIIELDNLYEKATYAKKSIENQEAQCYKNDIEKNPFRLHTNDLYTSIDMDGTKKSIENGRFTIEDNIKNINIKYDELKENQNKNNEKIQKLVLTRIGKILENDRKIYLDKLNEIKSLDMVINENISKINTNKLNIKRLEEDLKKIDNITKNIAQSGDITKVSVYTNKVQSLINSINLERSIINESVKVINNTLETKNKVYTSLRISPVYNTLKSSNLNNMFNGSLNPILDNHLDMIKENKRSYSKHLINKPDTSSYRQYTDVIGKKLSEYRVIIEKNINNAKAKAESIKINKQRQARVDVSKPVQKPVVTPSKPVQKPVVTPSKPVQKPEPVVPKVQKPVVIPSKPAQKPEPVVPKVQKPVVTPSKPAQKPEPVVPKVQKPVVTPKKPVQKPEPVIPKVQKPEPVVPKVQKPVVTPKKPVQKPEPVVPKVQKPVVTPSKPVLANTTMTKNNDLKTSDNGLNKITKPNVKKVLTDIEKQNRVAVKIAEIYKNVFPNATEAHSADSWNDIFNNRLKSSEAERNLVIGMVDNAITNNYSDKEILQIVYNVGKSTMNGTQKALFEKVLEKMPEKKRVVNNNILTHTHTHSHTHSHDMGMVKNTPMDNNIDSIIPVEEEEILLSEPIDIPEEEEMVIDEEEILLSGPIDLPGEEEEILISDPIDVPGEEEMVIEEEEIQNNVILTNPSQNNNFSNDTIPLTMNNKNNRKDKNLTNQDIITQKNNNTTKYIGSVGKRLQDKIDIDYTKNQNPAKPESVNVRETRKYIEKHNEIVKKQNKSKQDIISNTYGKYYHNVGGKMVEIKPKTDSANFSYKPQVEYTHQQPSNEILSAYGWSFMPPQVWSVPQKRPPACIPTKQNTERVVPIYDKSTPVDALDWTQVGSILPKHEYKEVSNKNYYHPGWIAQDKIEYPMDGKVFKTRYYNLNAAKPTK